MHQVDDEQTFYGIREKINFNVLGATRVFELSMVK